MFCHNKPLFRARSEGLGRLAHSVYSDKFLLSNHPQELLSINQLLVR